MKCGLQITLHHSHSHSNMGPPNTPFFTSSQTYLRIFAVFQSFSFHSSFFFSISFYGGVPFFSKQSNKREFFTLLDYPSFFYHTPNIGFGLIKCVVRTNQYFRKVIVDMIKRSKVFKFLQRKG